MIEPEHMCKKCILLDGSLGVSVNASTGICNYCEDPEYKTPSWWKTQITEEMRREGLEDWQRVIERAQSRRGEQKYDCIVGYSGGKDSTALLWKMVNEYNLNPLAVTIDSGFIPETAFENVKDTLQKIRVDHVIIDSAQETFPKLYKWMFLHQDSEDKCLTTSMCEACSDLVHALVVKEALNQDIDLILFGYSPDEIRRYYYEIPQHEIIDEWMPQFFWDETFSEMDRDHFVTLEEVKEHSLPRILLPYHVLDYEEDKIIELVESKDLVKKGNSSTLKTSCHVIMAASFYDLNRYGIVPYALQFSELIRQDPSVRKKWVITMKQLSPLIREGKFNEQGFNFALEKMGMTKSQLSEIIQHQLDLDPNREKIIRNVELFTSQRRRTRN
ncbi:MAG: hypothetical protein KGD61_07435 [Candidatus Lokiarchaeota archaeon]|nr:hypothetical protein [Candidatus Lokiarchaeota archaeon]